LVIDNTYYQKSFFIKIIICNNKKNAIKPYQNTTILISKISTSFPLLLEEKGPGDEVPLKSSIAKSSKLVRPLADRQIDNR